MKATKLIDRNSPAWRKMFSDVKDRKFDIILCKSQSRFARDMEIVERYIHGLFPICGVRFIIDNADTDQRGNKKSRYSSPITYLISRDMTVDKGSCYIISSRLHKTPKNDNKNPFLFAFYVPCTIRLKF